MPLNENLENTEDNPFELNYLNTDKKSVDKKMVDIQLSIKAKHDDELKRLRDKQRAEKAAINKRLRSLRNSAIYKLGSAFDKLGLLGVEYYAVLGCLAQARPELLNPESMVYKEFVATGEQIYKDGKKKD